MDITKLKIGETVYFDGEFQYANMHSIEPIECKAGEAVVINI